MGLELIKELDKKQKEVSKLDDLIKLKKSEFEASIESIKLKKQEIDSKIAEIKSQVESEAIKNFKETKDKNYLAGIKVQETNNIIYDEKEALNWAIEKKMFLLLDKKAFEKAVDSIGVDFVKKEKGERATFPKELKLED